MASITCFHFPSEASQINKFLQSEENNRSYVVVGVIGRSASHTADKMKPFQFSDTFLSTHKPNEGDVKFFIQPEKRTVFLHFETVYDAAVMREMQQNSSETPFLIFNSKMRSRFAKSLMFAIHVCHIIVFTDPGNTFDTSHLHLFRSLKNIRERHVTKFLPKLLRNTPMASYMGKDGRLCSPRFIFFFEKYIGDFYQINSNNLKNLEYDLEDNIYKMLRTDFIITNNSQVSLFSIPRNKPFVVVNTDEKLSIDPILSSSYDTVRNITKSYNYLNQQEVLNEINPFFGIPNMGDNYEKQNNSRLMSTRLMNLIEDHIKEAIDCGFDDSMSKFKGHSHFAILDGKLWFELFEFMHETLLSDNSEFYTTGNNDNDSYTSYIEKFDQIIDLDDKFLTDCCKYAVNLALDHYQNLLPHQYDKVFHQQRVAGSIKIFMKYARGPNVGFYEQKVRDKCDSMWLDDRQLCEVLSLKGNACILKKHVVKDLKEHCSTITYVSACNCGKTQGRREDPYTIEQANYEFYTLMTRNCPICVKQDKIDFPIFKSSSSEIRSAYKTDTVISEISTPAGLPQGNNYLSQDDLNNEEKINLSLPDSIDDILENSNNEERGQSSSSDDESVNEFVIKVKAEKENYDMEKSTINRQASTTEFLVGLIHMNSPSGILPLFPSWSLICLGSSAIYSHNTGLLESQQPGFIANSNFLLPWDVKVRLEHSASWAITYEKSRHRKKPNPIATAGDSNIFMLKIFIGFEYECRRGHRFMMASHDRVLRGGSGVVKDSGSKIAFCDMPIYFACPCKNEIGQMMRIHVVTPKAPVNVVLEPKLRIGEQKAYTFVTGLPQPPKLSQSSYWVMRLPYIYEGDSGPISPPTELTGYPLSHGYLMGGMFGIVETEVDQNIEYMDKSS